MKTKKPRMASLAGKRTRARDEEEEERPASKLAKRASTGAHRASSAGSSAVLVMRERGLDRPQGVPQKVIAGTVQAKPDTRAFCPFLPSAEHVSTHAFCWGMCISCFVRCASLFFDSFLVFGPV